MRSNSPPLVDTYNARWLTASQVAESFVAPPQFRQLSNHCHTILVGPRGSGKTTLLKMLQQQALERWAAPEADEYRRRVDFTGVFVPADISWREQLQSLKGDNLDSYTHELLVSAAFTLHIVRAIVDSIGQRIRPIQNNEVSTFRRVALTPHDEETLVTTIDDGLSIGAKLPSLLSLRHAIEARLAQIAAVARQEQLFGGAGRADRLQQHAFLWAGALPSASICINTFDDLVGEGEAKWALCFDELEIAPDSIQHLLIASTRSVSHKLLFKLALSPYNTHAMALTGITAPSAGNDFDQIQLWYANKDQRGSRNRQRDFCRRLWLSMLSSRGINKIDPRVALGEAFLLTPESWAPAVKSPIPVRGPQSAYAANGIWGARFISLYESDGTFKDFLDQRGISPYRLDELTPPVRDSIVRKVAPIVAVREFYRRPPRTDSEVVGGRSRKSVEIYTGWEPVFDISEGHPRWIKVTLGTLIDNWIAGGDAAVPRSMQGHQLVSAAQRFSSLLRTYPVSPRPNASRDGSLLSLVQKIAEYFHDLVVKEPFNPEPYLSFIVDSDTDEALTEGLQAALNLGAIVYVPDREGQVMLTSLKGKRFRISFWLAPAFGLPLILGKSVSLQRVLARRLETRADESHTLRLPFGEDES